MFKYILPLILTSFLFSEGISTEKKMVPVNQSFIVDNNNSTFDTSINYTHKPLLTCSPKINAIYKVVSEKALKVIPRKALQTNTTYSCSYKEEAFTFKTERFKVLNADYFKREKMLRLSFNDEINASSISQGIQLIKMDKLSKTNLKYSLFLKNSKNIILKINEKIGKETIKLVINKKLKTLQAINLDEVYTQRFNERSKTVELDKEKKSISFGDDPQMVAVEDGGFALRIFVNDNFTGDIKNFIEIEGIEEFTVQEYQYLEHNLRKKHKIQDSYYYHDVSSKEFKPNTSYNITLKKGLTSYFTELKEEVHYTLKTKDRAKVILFNEEKPYISNHGELSFSSVNIDKATLVVERILNDNLRYFMNFNAGNQEEVQNYTKEVFTKELILNQEKNIVLKQKFKLSDLNEGELPVGVYKVTLRFEELLDGKEVERASSKILFLSNLGISANIGKDQAFISVLSLDEAKPIENAKIEIYGAHNELIATAKTNEDGIAIVKDEKMLEHHPKGIIVQNKKDKNFLALSESISTPSIDEILQNKERFKAHIYFQARIVRPKAKIHALITIKDRDFISASKLPIKVVFQEMYGKKLYEKVYHTDEYGLIDFSYQLDNNDKTGDYKLNAYMGDKLIGSKRIKVEAFMPPKIENSIKTNKEIYQADEIMEVNISSSYLFGAPTSNAQGKVTLTARPINYLNKAYKNYSFNNAELAKVNVNNYIDQSEEIVLDEKGEFKMVMKNHLSQKVPSILEAMIGVTIMDDAQPVSKYKKVKIYPYTAMVGLKLNADSFEKGKKLEGKAILLDPMTGKEIKRELYAVVKKVDWHYDYREGNYHWEKETNVVDHFTLNSNETFSREVLENGDHVIEISDRLGGHSASASFDVWWWNYSNISPSNDLKSVEIKIEDKLYSKGDKLNIEIKSPILEGQLILTLEGEAVQEYKRIEIHKGVAKTSFTINNDIQRGLRLHATVVRGSNSDSKLIPFRAMGYKFVKANRNTHKIEVSLELPKESKSKTTLPIGIKTSKPSKVLISIVDRGILQLVGQKEPKIFNYFNEEPEKQMSYYDLYDQLLAYIAEGKLVDFGAGDMLTRKQKHLAPDLGKRIKPFMIWSGIVETNGSMTKLNVKIPEFNGRAAVVAIAINGDSIGVSNQELVVKDDIMIKPSFPRYGLSGDKIEVPIRIFNTTKEMKEVTLSVKASKNLEFKLEKSILTIPANSSKHTTALLSPNAGGKSSITLSANYDNTQVDKSIELPILSPYAISTKTFKGIANKTVTINIPKAYKNAKVYLSLSDNLVGALRDELKYLVEYPYGCAEQTSSKLSAMHYAKAFLPQDKLLKRSEHFILQGIKKLHNMQNYWGEFNYWEGDASVHAYASLYTTETLLDIAREGGAIKESLKKKMINMLNNVALENENYEASYTNFHRVYAAYILAENSQLSKSISNMLYEKKVYKGHFLATFYMAAILKIQGKTKEAEKLFKENNYELSRYANKPYGDKSGNFESNVRDMMLHFIIKTKYFDKDAKDLIAIQKEFSNLDSTQSKAVALKAISTYIGEATPSKVDVTLNINGETSQHKKPEVIRIDKVTSDSITLTPNGTAMSYSVELVKHLPKAVKNSLSKQDKISIKREFIDAKGHSVDLKNLTQGQKLFSKVTLVNYGKVNNVVVSQRIPACLTIVNNNIQEQAPTFKDMNISLAHKEIRDDRILHFLNLPKKEKWSDALHKYIALENKGTFYAPLIATSVGECKMPAVISEAMYDTDINAYAKEVNSIIVKALKK